MDMQKTLIAALALTGTAAFPALAQGTNQNQTGAQTGSQSGQQMQAQQGGQMTEDQMRSRLASQAQVRDALTQSGFEEVTLLDAAYLVSARAPSGEMVMMVVNPSGLMQGMMQGMGQNMGQNMGQGMGQPGMNQDATGSTNTMPGQQNQSGQGQTNQ
ncbi:hypothetical protein [Salinarimonas ramus]|uniref:Uncharacterized protein n=1 Tax=Salinarimonas ramus TaxID=690164 RepID=A0A917QBT6_9HYPH|nr:hypothetical protein [Salinarimonas ramus]GGK41816.1 hypothetical protein GCM10011322_31210 [Salinarimonas ramus]